MERAGSNLNARCTLFIILTAGLAATTILNFYFIPQETNFESSSTLGTEATPTYGATDGYPVHCLDIRDAKNCLAGQRSRGAKYAALWLGNSQLSDINQWKPGEKSAPTLLFDLLAPINLDLLTFSLASACLQENYVIFEYLRQRMPLKVLILPVVFDDMREEGLRNGVTEFVRDTATANALSRTPIGKRLVASARSKENTELASNINDTSGITGTVQDFVEKNLNQWLGDNSRLWQLRPEIRGWIFIGLYRLRNAVFGITPNSTRKKIPGRYRENMAALRAILDISQMEGIRVVLYNVPLRSDVKIPYEYAEYSSFKAEIATIAQEYQVNFKNLEHLVPDRFWGTKASTTIGEAQEIDFMHFTSVGHEILAKEVAKIIIEELVNK